MTAVLERPPLATIGAKVEAAKTAVPRVALWDNARLLLIVLVVFGHSIESIRGPQAIDTVYDVIFAFHMPAFLLVSGYFARSERPTAKTFMGTAQLVVTWLIVEFGWAAARAIEGHNPFPSTFLVVPGWSLWFLVSLFCMRVLLPYVATLPFPLIASIVVALGAGLISSIGTEFSASRTLALLPFFVLGWTLRRRGLGNATWFSAPSIRVRLAAAAVGTGAVLGVIELSNTPAFTTQLVFWRRSYAGESYDDLTGIGMRALMLLIGAAITMAVLVLIPRRHGWWSRFGANTMAVYILHTPVIEVLRFFHVDDAIAGTATPMMLMLLVAIAMVGVLGSPPVARVLRVVTEPRWLFRRGIVPAT
jgi:fucose 4-O-acetylase-like acetyltransferase